MNTFQIVRLIGEAPKELISSTENHLLTRMAFIGNKDGENIKASINEFIKQTKLSKSTIVRSLKSLVKNKILKIIHTSKDKYGEVSNYSINISVLQDKKNYKNLYNTGVTMTPVTGVTMTPVDLEKSNSLVSPRHQCGVTMTPVTGVTMTPQPYIQLLEPILEPTNVELGANSTFVSTDKKLSKISKKKNWKLEVEEVFDYWRKVMNRDKSKLDKKRTAKLILALEHGFSVDDLKKAVDGAKKSPFHRGDNKSGTIYDSIDLIFRNPEKIETFISIFDTQTTPGNKNVATGLKMTFVEKNKSQVNMIRKLGDKYFPEFSDTPNSEINKQSLLTLIKEDVINEYE